MMEPDRSFLFPFPLSFRRLLIACAIGAVVGLPTTTGAQPVPRLGQGEGDALPAGCVLDGRPLEERLAAVLRCQRHPGFLANLGHDLNGAGRFHEAVEHLERALLLEPGRRDVQVDFSVALAGVGDAVAAAALIDDLMADPTLPPPLRPVLRAQRDRLAEASEEAGTGLRWRRTAGLRFGHDSNLRGAPGLSSLTLTFTDRSLELPLDESYQVRAGAYLRADASIEGRVLTSSGVRHDLFASARLRGARGVSSANTEQLEVAYERYSPWNGGQPGLRAGRWGWYAGANASGFRTRSGVRYGTQGLSAGVEWSLPSSQAASGRERLAGCQARVGGEWQARDLHSNTLLSGRYAGLQASWRCTEPNGTVWLASTQVGRDRPRDATRPGAAQDQWGLRFSGLWPNRAWLPAAVDWPGQILVDLDLQRLQDAAGYSPLLESGAARRILRSTLRVELQTQPRADSQWLIGVEWVRQHSNLGLFSLRSFGPYVAWRTAW